ncbi:MAG: bifunctional oligoribonuclease/PAP phosphatase NrnA, partial [Candidatus Omnitrophota bacterium]
MWIDRIFSLKTSSVIKRGFEIDNYAKTIKLIKDARSIAISCHMHADGDCLGSLSALGLALMGMKKKVSLYSPGRIPPRYAFLPLHNKINKGRLKRSYDLAISVDCGNKHRLGHIYEDVFTKSRSIVEIDHHATRTAFGDIQLLDHDACSAGQIVYNLIRRLGVKIDKEIAMSLLVSLIVETGSFRFPSVSADTFRICSELLETGVNFNAITNACFWIKTPSEVQLTGLCMSRIKFKAGGKIAYSSISQKDFHRFKGKDENIDPAADEIRAIKDIKAVILFRELNSNTIRVSLRSKNSIDVGKVAKIFDGGGHYDVAGCYIQNSQRSKNALLREVESAVKDG